jgi:hypothetical protein
MSGYATTFNDGRRVYIYTGRTGEVLLQDLERLWTLEAPEACAGDLEALRVNARELVDVIQVETTDPDEPVFRIPSITWTEGSGLPAEVDPRWETEAEFVRAIDAGGILGVDMELKPSVDELLRWVTALEQGVCPTATVSRLVGIGALVLGGASLLGLVYYVLKGAKR